MSLQRQQDMLARVYTDATFRSDFLKDPAAYADDLGLSPLDAESLAAAAGCEVQWFADSLVNKRLREVKKLLPLTEQEIGANAFERRFRKFADGFSPESVKKHLEDALAFADRLASDRSLEDQMRDIACFEARRLRHNAHGRSISCCLLRFDPRRAIGYRAYGSRRGLGIWIAIGGWSRIFFRVQRLGP